MTQTLTSFIEQVGDAEAMRLFRVPKRTVQSWRRKERVPRPDTAQAIVAATDGRVTLDGIYKSLEAAPASEVA